MSPLPSPSPAVSDSIPRVPDRLKDGVYDHLLDEALAALAGEARREQARRVDILNRLLATLADAAREHCATREPPLDPGETRVPAPRHLRLVGHRLALGAEAPVVLHETPRAASALLVNAAGEPSLGRELCRELASAHRVDLLCAFVKWSRLRFLLNELSALVIRVRARGEPFPVRVLTTTYIGASDVRAIKERARIGAVVRISHSAPLLDKLRATFESWDSTSSPCFLRARGARRYRTGSSRNTSTISTRKAANMSWEQILKLIRSQWTAIVLTLLSGIACVAFSQADIFGAPRTNADYITRTLLSETTGKIIEHLGAGLLVAGFVALFFHAREFSDFFRHLAEAILIKEEYLRRLSDDSLRQIRQKTAQLLIGKHVTNPEYRHEEVSKWADDSLFERLVPRRGPSDFGLYREDYVDQKHLIFLSGADLWARLKIQDAPATDLRTARFIIERTKMQFHVVSPFLKGQAPYSPSISGDYVPIAGIKPEEQIRVTDAKVVFDTAKHKYTSSLPQVPFVNGVASVTIEMEEIRPAAAQPYSVGTMRSLTHGLTVLVSTEGEARPDIRADVFAPGGEFESNRLIGGTLELKYPKWLLEDQGYMVWW
jgi:hypothetical protein